MTFWQLIDNPDVAIKMVAATLCAIVGLALLVMDRRARKPLTQLQQVRKPLPVPVVRLRPLVAEPARLGPDAQYSRLRETIAEAGTRTVRMNACQQSAAIQLDSAEMALRRLVDEISSVMPISLGQALVPRRHIAVVGTREPSSAPLAA